MATLLVERPAMPAPPKLRPLPEPSLLPFPSTLFSFGDRNKPLSPSLPFTFSVPTAPDRPRPLFTFSLVANKCPADPGYNPLKRRRRLTDVDGDGTAPLLRKKRRLLKTLITSRLSTPFSYPATHIGDRGSSKAVHWARIRRTRGGAVSANVSKVGSGAGVGPGGGSQDQRHRQQQQQTCGQEPVLRKAAILNRLRLLGVRSRSPTEVSLAAAAAQPIQDQLRRSQEPQGDAMRSTDEPFVEAAACQRVESPNMAAASALPYAPLEPSPLALSNYDALDLEDEWPDDEEEEEDDDDDGGGGRYDCSGNRRRESIYSDFSVFDTSSCGDDDDYDDNRNTLGFSALPH